jgi:LPS-assembly protein
MARLLVFLVLAATVVVAAVAHAQTPVDLGASGGDVDILADHMEQPAPDLMIATGNVEITKGNTRLSADRVELNRATGDAVATGRVVFFDGQDRMTGPRIDYNIKTGTGVIHDAKAFSAPYYRLSGERLERLDESVYKIYRGVFTTCEDEPPVWSVSIGSGRADFDDYLFGQNAVFRVLDVPILPVPVFAAALRRERQTGFLPPTFGDSSVRGYFAKIPFFWAISDSQDLTVALDSYSQRGVGLNAEYRYILSRNAQGVATGFFIQETEVTDDLRGYAHVRHNWTVDPTLSLKVDLNRVSDDDLFREYGDRLYERSLQHADSNVFVSKRWPQWNFVANAFWYQDLTTPRPIELQRLPDVRLTSVSQPIPGLRGAVWDFESSAIRFVRDVGSEGDRLDLHPRARMPFRPFGLFTVTPFVGARTTTYDQKVVGTETRYSENRVLELTQDTLRTRVLGETGADLEARASRIYDVDAWGIARMAHQIEPRVNYTFVDGVNKDRLPQWDSVDAITRTNAFTYSVTNRLIAKTPAGPGETPVKWELVRFVLGQTFNADVSDAGRPFGNVTGDLIVDPTKYVRLRADAAYSVYKHDAIRSVNSDIGLVFPDVTASIGTRFNADSNIEFYRAEATGRVSRYLSLRGSSDFDADKGVSVENRVGADIHFQCWALALTYVYRPNASLAPSGTQTTGSDNEFRFSLDLLGLGALGGQTGFTQ